MKPIAAVILAFLALTVPALAQAPAAPTGPVVLTVTGSNGEQAAFDQGMLDALPQHETITHTPWHDGQQVFSGPLFRTVLEAAGAEGETATVVAINDYAADLPRADIETIPVILATRRNGELMTVRENGPIFVIYPFDAQPELFNEVYFGRSVWQVKAIVVK